MINNGQLLLQYGTQVDTLDNSNRTPLQLLAHPKVSPTARKMGRLLVWYHYILLPHFIKHVPEKAHAWAIASHVAVVCAEHPSVWS